MSKSTGVVGSESLAVNRDAVLILFYIVLEEVHKIWKRD